MDNSIHIILQPQSGIGKKYIAFILKQYLISKNKVKYYSIQEKNIPLWDQILDEFFTRKNQIFIIVISSACFEYFQSYLNETKILVTGSQIKDQIFNHYIFTPGRNGEGVKNTLDFILCDIKKRSGKNIIWENYNLGITLKEFTKGQYSRVTELPEYKQIESDVFEVVHLPAQSFYFQKELSSHVQSGQTFDQAIYNSENNLTSRQRLYQIKKRTFGAIENAGI